MSVFVFSDKLARGIRALDSLDVSVKTQKLSEQICSEENVHGGCGHKFFKRIRSLKKSTWDAARSSPNAPNLGKQSTENAPPNISDQYLGPITKLFYSDLGPWQKE